MRRLTLAAAGLLGMVGGVALAGWLSGLLLLASLGPRFIPMAPLTALAFLLLAAAFTLCHRGRIGAWTAASAGAAVAIVGAARLATSFRPALSMPEIEAALVRDAGLFGVVPMARISPLTAAALTAAGVAAVLIAAGARHRGADVAGWLGAAVGMIGGTVLLGYVYGTPLLYGGQIIPVALPTGFGLSFAGIAAMGAAGEEASPLRAFVGGSARARLMRSFLPRIVSLLLVASAGGHLMISRAQANPAVAAACSTLAAAALVASVIWRTAGSVGAAIDLAEETLTRSHAQLESAVAARTAQLERINGELNAFSSSVSHDLRAPLRHMLGFARLLDEGYRAALPPQGQTYLDRIRSAGDRMSRLIDDLLTFARTAQAPLRAQRLDVTALVEEVIAEVSHDLDGRVIEWRIGRLPDVVADRALLRQVLTNLLSNAIKYTAPRDPGRIEVGALPSSRGWHVLYVRDNGVGFDMAYADKLFGVFQRLHGADEFEGTGIGLANVRRIVERHGGTVRAEAEVNKGATFFVSLPVEEALHT